LWRSTARHVDEVAHRRHHVAHLAIGGCRTFGVSGRARIGLYFLNQRVTAFGGVAQQLRGACERILQQFLGVRLGIINQIARLFGQRVDVERGRLRRRQLGRVGFGGV